MKPWFVKEAEVIKFPEPEKKVLDMPSVASYPDFMTGVSDLKARRHKGDISQASHDKLYTDLIHRFMKKESFETPWFLREQDEGPVGQAAQDLIATANASNDPEYEKETQNLLVKARDFLKKILSKPQTEDVSPQVESTLAEIRAMMQQFKQESNYTPEQKKDVETQLTQSFLQMIGRKEREAEKRGEVTGVEKGRDELNDFLTKYDNAIGALTNKITTSEQVFVDANSEGTGKTMRKEVARKQNTIEVIKGVISSIFTGDLFKAGTITDRQLQGKLLSFLNASKEGIVDWGTILKAGKGKKASVEQFVPAEYKEMFEMFKDKLFNSRPPTTAGAWGPGEVGLILIGNPITKASDGGDLMDANTGVKFELKSSNNEKKGGRLSPDGLSTDEKKNEFNKIKKDYFGVALLKKLGSKSRIGKHHSVNVGFIEEFNTLIDKGLRTKGRAFNTKQFLIDIIKAAFSSNVPSNKELLPYVNKMIVNNKIEYDKFVRTYSKFLMDRYQGLGEDKNFSSIIVFNPKSTTYTVLDSSKDLDSADVVITGGIEFGAKQVPKSPQIGIK